MCWDKARKPRLRQLIKLCPKMFNIEAQDTKNQSPHAKMKTILNENNNSG